MNKRDNSRSAKSVLLKWLDDTVLANKGLLGFLRIPHFWLLTIILTLIFSFVLQFFTQGTGKLTLLIELDWPDKLKVLLANLEASIGIGLQPLDFLLVISLSWLQGMLLAMIIISNYHQQKIKAETPQTNHLDRAGIIAGLAILGAGCPTCGTTMIAPLLGSILSSTGYLVASKIALWITGISFIIAILAIRKICLDFFAIQIQYKRSQKNA